ncbi:MAG: hypothetical protein AB7E30_02295 [Lawsonibacter sp.]
MKENDGSSKIISLLIIPENPVKIKKLETKQYRMDKHSSKAGISATWEYPCARSNPPNCSNGSGIFGAIKDNRQNERNQGFRVRFFYSFRTMNKYGTD